MKNSVLASLVSLGLVVGLLPMQAVASGAFEGAELPPPRKFSLHH